MKIILSCAFGEESSDVKLPFISNGVIQHRYIGDILRDLFLYCAFRSAREEVILLPYIMFFYYSKADKEFLQNTKAVRGFAKELLLKRREKMREPDYVESADLLSILLTDDLFKDNEESIIDECMTFFLAGS